MLLKPIIVAAAFGLSACATTTAFAQDPAHEHGGGDRFERMEEMREAFASADDAAERRALMHEHMALMREQMHASEGMMGGHGMMADDDGASMERMHEHMSNMHQMMMQMMSQHEMMMEMQGHSDED